MRHRLKRLFFPPKCVLCGKLLSDEETDLCHDCRIHAPVFSKGNFKISFVARWTAVWYYKDMVRAGILRYKFGGRRSYAPAYGKFLAMKLQTAKFEDFDVLTWVPISRQRLRKRRYDQVELIAHVVAEELGVQAVKALEKIRHTPPQSTLPDLAARKANVMGAFQVTDPEAIREQRVLLLDDIITTGATASECARVLLTAGAKEVVCAALAAAEHNKKQSTLHM